MIGEKGIHLKTGCSINMSSSHKSAIISKQMRKKQMIGYRERKLKGLILNLFYEWPALKEGHRINKFNSPNLSINWELTKKQNLMINKTFTFKRKMNE